MYDTKEVNRFKNRQTERCQVKHPEEMYRKYMIKVFLNVFWKKGNLTDKWPR